MEEFKVILLGNRHIRTWRFMGEPVVNGWKQILKVTPTNSDYLAIGESYLLEPFHERALLWLCVDSELTPKGRQYTLRVF